MTFEERVIVSAQDVGWVGPGDRMIEHLAHGDAINITSVNAKPDDAPTPLVDDDQHPVGLEN
jgi:hypothetical protein